MNFADTNGMTIKAAFDKFDKENPNVYQYFKQYAREMLKSGCKRISSKRIISRIRGDFYIEKKEDIYKINDAFTAWYARKFIEHYPIHKDKFEFRRIRATVGDCIDKLFQINADGQSEMILK